MNRTAQIPAEHNAIAMSIDHASPLEISETKANYSVTALALKIIAARARCDTRRGIRIANCVCGES